MSKNNENKLVPRLRFPEFAMEGEWEILPLSKLSYEITEKTKGRKFKLMSITSGVGLVSQIEKFGKEIAGNSYDNYYVLKKGDFAYNKSSTKLYPEGEVAMLEKEENGAVPNSIFTCFSFDKNKIYPIFAKYPFINNIHGRWLKKFIAVGARANGALQVNSKDLFSIPFPYPSFKEQQKIAACLSSLDDVITAESKKLEVLKEHKKGLLQNLFPQEGETVPKLRFKEFEDSGEWVQTYLEENCQVKGRIGFRGYTTEDLVGQGEGALVLGGKHIQNQMLELKNPTYLSWEKYYESPEIMVEVGNIIFSQRGTLGDCAIIDKEIGPATINPSMVLLKNINCNAKFLFFILISDRIQNEVQKYRAMGAIPMLSQKQIKEFSFLIPKNPEEQQKIADTLSSLDNLINSQSQKIETLKLHKKGLLQGLFPDINEHNG